MVKESKDILTIQKSLEKTLDDKRYIHSLGVEYTAASLAMCYGEDIVKAELAGLLHDCAKCIDDRKKILICEKNNICMSDLERRNPFLLHAKVGSFIAMSTYSIQDSDIINAILNHTTGRPGMSLLEKIIFVSDYIEPSRKKAPNLPKIRKMAFNDLNKTIVLILADTLRYLKDIECEIDPMTQKSYEYYLHEE